MLVTAVRSYCRSPSRQNAAPKCRSQGCCAWATACPGKPIISVKLSEKRYIAHPHCDCAIKWRHKNAEYQVQWEERMCALFTINAIVPSCRSMTRCCANRAVAGVSPAHGLSSDGPIHLSGVSREQTSLVIRSERAWTLCIQSN